MTKRIRTKLLFAEIVLIIASVFIFRGLWLLLDLYPVMHEEWVLVLSLIVGIVLTIPAMRYILRYG